MRANVKRREARARVWPVCHPVYRLATTSDNGNGPARGMPTVAPELARDEFPYRIELWNNEKSAVDLVLAVACHASIGYVAFLEASREFPDRYVTMRHEGKILMRFDGTTH